MVPAFLVGVVVAPVVGKFAKTLFRGTVKATVGVGLQVQKVAAEAVEEFQDLSAEAKAEAAAAEAAAAEAAAAEAQVKSTYKAAPPKRV